MSDDDFPNECPKLGECAAAGALCKRCRKQDQFVGKNAALLAAELNLKQVETELAIAQECARQANYAASVLSLHAGKLMGELVEGRKAVAKEKEALGIGGKI